MGKKTIYTQCPRCGLEYGGQNAMRLDEVSINGRTPSKTCMCGTIYKNGLWWIEDKDSPQGHLYYGHDGKLYRDISQDY
jgi:hypothetical protein